MWRNDGKDRRRGRSAKWHGWFAWHPIKVGTVTIWLEHVERRGGFDITKNIAGRRPWVWEYRSIEEKAA